MLSNPRKSVQVREKSNEKPLAINCDFLEVFEVVKEHKEQQEKDSKKAE